FGPAPQRRGGRNDQRALQGCPRGIGGASTRKAAWCDREISEVGDAVARQAASRVRQIPDRLGPNAWWSSSDCTVAKRAQALLEQTGLQAMNYRVSTEAGTALHAVGESVDHEGREFTPVAVQIVPTYALDDLIDVLKLPPPTRLKLDVDGFEYSVLRGANTTL